MKTYTIVLTEFQRDIVETALIFNMVDIENRIRRCSPGAQTDWLKDQLEASRNVISDMQGAA